VKVFAYQKTEEDSVLGYKRAKSLSAKEIQQILNEGMRDQLRAKLFQSKKKVSGLSVNSGSTEDSNLGLEN